MKTTRALRQVQVQVGAIAVLCLLLISASAIASEILDHATMLAERAMEAGSGGENREEEARTREEGGGSRGAVASWDAAADMWGSSSEAWQEASILFAAASGSTDAQWADEKARIALTRSLYARVNAISNKLLDETLTIPNDQWEAVEDAAMALANIILTLEWDNFQPMPHSLVEIEAYLDNALQAVAAATGLPLLLRLDIIEELLDAHQKRQQLSGW